MFRVGSGFDVHKFAPERKLILCGVDIPSELGLAGHSDADVAVHALMDALLGALALGDIGMHFPDNDAAYKGADSMELLGHVLGLKEFSDWYIANIDLTIIAQAPKLAPYREDMRRSLAEKTGVKDFVVEQDRNFATGDSMESIEYSYKYIKANLMK